MPNTEIRTYTPLQVDRAKLFATALTNASKYEHLLERGGGHIYGVDADQNQIDRKVDRDLVKGAQAVRQSLYEDLAYKKTTFWTRGNDGLPVREEIRRVDPEGKELAEDLIRQQRENEIHGDVFSMEELFKK